MKKLIVYDLMKIYPDDKTEGIIIHAVDHIEYADLLELSDKLIVKLHSIGKFNTRKLAEQLNNDMQITIHFN